MPRLRPTLRLPAATPVSLTIGVGAVLIAVVLAAAGITVASTATSPATPKPSVPAPLAVAGGPGQSLPSPDASPPVAIPSPVFAGVAAPAKIFSKPALSKPVTAAPVAPAVAQPAAPPEIPASVSAAMAWQAAAGQFQGVSFGCSAPRMEAPQGQPGTMQCAVTSVNGFAGQIRTECDPFTTPTLVLPALGHPTDPGYVTCSAPDVTLAAGGGAMIPVTVQALPSAPAGWGAPIYLTLWSGTTKLNADPFEFGVVPPPVPWHVTLSCQVVTETANDVSVTSTNAPTVTINLGPEWAGTCTLTALDPASIVPVGVQITDIVSPNKVPRTAWPTCFNPVEATAIRGVGTGCQDQYGGIIPTGGSTTFWFAIGVPPTAVGGGPTSFTFEASANATSPPVFTTITIPL